LVLQSSSSKCINKFKYTQKDSSSCGYYCALALINSIGSGRTKNLASKVKLTKNGVRQSNLIKCLRNEDIAVTVYYNLTYEKMQHFLSQGKYIVVYSLKGDHWMVLCRAEKGWLWFYDPENLYNIRKYSRMKKDLNGFGIVCSSKN
jgi:ABC-type bacteriocin/lantibiotic exporter with double-glycine peptidase domain